jgi:hypothetical protein
MPIYKVVALEDGYYGMNYQPQEPVTAGETINTIVWDGVTPIDLGDVRLSLEIA